MTNYIGLEVPVGTVMPCVDFYNFDLGEESPFAWLLCNGQQISTSVYPDLYTVIGSTYNTGGESSGIVRVPNLVNRIPYCGESDIGNTGGSSNYTLSESHMPSHRHSFTQSAHHHYFSNIHGDDGNNSGGSNSYYNKTIAQAWNDGSNTLYKDQAGNWLNPHSGYAQASLNSGNAGSGNSFNAIPASRKVVYIIKT
jgi:microcystin-dependent protein